MGPMAIEIARLCLGLLIVAFHQRIADFVLERERSLVIAFRGAQHADGAQSLLRHRHVHRACRMAADLSDRALSLRSGL